MQNLVTPPARRRFPKYVAGRYYQFHSVTLAAGLVTGGNSIRLCPFVIENPITLSGLTARVTTAEAGQNYQLAIYRSDPDTCFPTTLVCNTPSRLTTSTGIFDDALVQGNTLLPPGLYWMAVNTSSATAVFGSYSATTPVASRLIGAVLNTDAWFSATNSSLCYSFAQAFGTWPDLTGQTFVPVAGSSYAAVVGIAA